MSLTSTNKLDGILPDLLSIGMLEVGPSVRYSFINIADPGENKNWSGVQTALMIPTNVTVTPRSALAT